MEGGTAETQSLKRDARRARLGVQRPVSAPRGCGDVLEMGSGSAEDGGFVRNSPPAPTDEMRIAGLTILWYIYCTYTLLYTICCMESTPYCSIA